MRAEAGLRKKAGLLLCGAQARAASVAQRVFNTADSLAGGASVLETKRHDYDNKQLLYGHHIGVGGPVEIAMGAFKAAGFFAFVFTLGAISLLIMVVMVEFHLADGVLIAISIAACLAALAWGVTGARLLSKWLFVALLIPGMMFGICILLTASDRYPPFHAYLVGFAAVLAFTLIGCALSWLSARPLTVSLANDALDERRGDILTVGGICLFVGVLFFQPAIILLNGQSDVRTPLVLTGTVARMYQTHGKGATDYIVLKGPAAAYSSTGAPGEFSVPANVYQASETGDRRCLTVHAGLMRFQWWTLGGC